MAVPWKIRHLDLRDALPALPSDPEIAGIFVVLWWNGVPLGELEIPVAELPLSVSQLVEQATRACAPAIGQRLLNDALHGVSTASGDTSLDLMNLERPLEQFSERLQTSRDPVPRTSVSVVVCTRDRPEALARCLGSLKQLAPAPHEIVIVDNAPRSGETRRLIVTMPDIRYVHEPDTGLSAARNAGVRATTGEIIAFTDDDVTVHPAWIAGLKRGFVTADVMAVTGHVLPAELETEAQVRFQHHDSGFGWGYRTREFDTSFFEACKVDGVPVWKIGAGANMAFRREAFAQVGPFDERLGAGASGCSEDSELWYRLLAEGWTCRYEPEAVVFHYHRRDLDALDRQMYHYMRGHVAALLIQYEKYGHPGNLRRAFTDLPYYFLRRLIRCARRGIRTDDGTLGAELRGSVAGLIYYLRRNLSSQP